MQLLYLIVALPPYYRSFENTPAKQYLINNSLIYFHIEFS